MAAALFQHGAIRTTEAKAKELRRFVEKLITRARRNTLHARRLVIRELGDPKMHDEDGDPMDKTVVQTLFDDIAPRYADRPGGYTRIIHLSDRRIGDAGRQVVLQLVEESAAEEGGPSATSKRRARAAKRREAFRAAKKASGARKPERESPEDEAEPKTEAEPAAEAPAEESEATVEQPETVEQEPEQTEGDAGEAGEEEKKDE